MKKLVLFVALSLLVLHPASGEEDDTYKSDLITLSMLLSIGLNLGLGFGLGSFVQGDVVGGIIQLTGEAVGMGIAFWCVIETVSPREPGEVMPAWVAPLGNAGACLVAGARGIWGILRPIRFAALKRAGLTGNKVTFDIAPSITPSAGPQGFDIGMRFSLRFALD